uniref:ShKT domain-containing protein n=1 Tax=Panagrolaimus sp. ES5 TaxID=591445 RepID=A0AC34GTC6_9BILA
MKAVFFLALFIISECNAQTLPSSLASTTASPALGCIGNCIGGDCPLGYSCNTLTQQCCLGTSTTTTSGTTCIDKIGPKGFSDCPQRAFLCNNTLYYTLMTDQCPKTCGRCNGSSSTAATTSSSTLCVDKTKADGTSDCPGLTRLCNNPAYYNLMTDQCPKTCGRCAAATTSTSTISVGRK